MINEQKKTQEKRMSEDKEQIRDQGKFNDDKKQVRAQGRFDDKELEAKWKKVRKPLQVKYPDLTDDDLHYNRGEFGNMLGRIGAKTGMTETQLRKKILSWDDSSSF